MKSRFKKNDVLTIPNLLSLIRLLLIPLIIWSYCGAQNHIMTVCFIALSALTDILDGKIARKFNMISDVGKVLDPIADKLTQAALIFCLISRHPWMIALLVLLALKEFLMMLWGYLTIKYTDTVNGAKWYGKVSTVVLYTAMMALILFPDIPDIVKYVLIALCAAVMLMSLILYGKFYYGIYKEYHSSTDNHA